MRCLAILIAIAAALVFSLAFNMIAVLSMLGSAPIALDPLVHGDLSELFVYGPVWALPRWSFADQMVAFGPMAVMAAVGALLLVAARRWRQVSSTWFALLALLAGAIPFAVGAIALSNNTSHPDTGPWLVWMLVGPAYAAVITVGFLIRGAWQGRRLGSAAMRTPVAVMGN